jgi:transcription termination factor NusB
VFVAGINKFRKTVSKNIQYYHECNDGTKLHRALDAESQTQRLFQNELRTDEQADENNDLLNEVITLDYTEEDVKDARVN